MMLRFLLTTVLFISLGATSSYATFHPLAECVSLLCPNEGENAWQLSYTHSEYKTYHSPRPFMTSHIAHTGTMWVGYNSIGLRDSFTTRERTYTNLKTFADGVLLKQPLNSKQPAKITKRMLAEEVFKIAKYYPNILLQHFEQQEVKGKEQEGYHLYTTRISDATVTLYIPKGNYILHKATITIDDEMYGDVVYTIAYSNYTATDKNGTHQYPQTITFVKINGITDTLQLSYVQPVATVPTLIEKPSDYTIHDNPPTVPHRAHTEQISDHLYSIHLPQAESAALLVSFKDFFVVLDAPLNSKNGALILEEAKKIAPNKPVRYYSFCHHHPWYVGGIRPFVHAGATVLTQASNIAYLEFITLNPHTLSPDALEREPRLLLSEVVGKTKTITDGTYKMVMHHIGKQSEHTEDYTLFYFPEEKILFQGDMVFIRENAPIQKARGKQLALYNAIKQLDLDVATIVQAWPWKSRYQMKTIIPFAELEQSVALTKEEE